MELSTIGYEGAALDDFIHTLVKTGVTRVIDIRELPQSRRPGFSKKVLSSALAESGIEYEHIKALGDPKPGREAARAGKFAQFEAIFSDHLESEGAQTALEHVAKAAKSEPCVLLCYERNPKHCHRNLVGQELTRLHSLVIRHLGVQPRATGGASYGSADRHASAC